jgi:hypothetical protein
MGLVPLLVPFVWVLEIDSCGHSVPLEKEITGTMVVEGFGLEAWMMSIPVLLAVVLIPYLAPRVQRLGLRVWLHVAGLVAAVLTGWTGFVIMHFAIFSERMVAGVGWLVLAAFAGSIVDALLRVVWSAQEWRAVRRASTTAPG